MPNTTGEVGPKERLLSSTRICLVQPHNVIENPNNFGGSVDSLPSEEVTEEKYRLNGIDKSVPVTISDSDSQHMNSIDVEGELRNVSVAVESQHMDKSTQSFPSPNHVLQEQKCEGKDISTHVIYHQGQCLPVDESEPYHLELNAIKPRDISNLKDSITSVGSQLLKLSIRREFLGINSIGRLYWASAVCGGRLRIVVDANALMLCERRMKVGRDYAEKFSYLPHLSDKDNNQMLGVVNDSYPLISQASDAVSMSPPWIAYETDAEIQELLGWLKDNDPKEKDLKDSIMQWPSQEFKSFSINRLKLRLRTKDLFLYQEMGRR